MAKLSLEEFKQKYSEKITDNDDLLIALMEDASDSFAGDVDKSAELAEIESLKAELEAKMAELADVKERYKARFLSPEIVEEVAEEVVEEELEPSEEEVIDIKEI